MPSMRQEKMNNELAKYISQSITELSSPQSLITVTHADVAPNFKNATAFISVIPTSEEHKALAFLERHAHNVRAHLKKQLATRVIPFITFKIDQGERNRQRIDELSRDVK